MLCHRTTKKHGIMSVAHLPCVEGVGVSLSDWRHPLDLPCSNVAIRSNGNAHLRCEMD